jgi:hypothetical protein
MPSDYENALTVKIPRDEKGKVYSYFSGLKTVEISDKKKLARIVGSPTLRKLQDKFLKKEPITLEDLTISGKVLPRPNSAGFIKDARKYLKQTTSTNKVNITWAGCPDISDGYGRVYPLSGLKSFVNLWRPIRGFLAKGVYIDLDIVNAHPEIIVQKCDSAQVECTFLREYVIERAKHLKSIQDTFHVDRDCAKKLFLIISYGGSFSDWLHSCNLPSSLGAEEPEYIKGLYNEMVSISDSFVRANPDLVESLLSRPGKSTTTSEASLVSYVAQTWEREVLEVIHQYLVKKKITTERSVCLCYDGLMIKIPDNWSDRKDDIIKGLEDEIYSSLRLNLKVTQKEFDDVLDEVLESYEELEDAYPAVKKLWEVTHFKCLESSLFYEVRADQIITRNKDALKTAFEHLEYINDTGEYEKFIGRWLKDKDMRCYQSAQYYLPPMVCPEGSYNLFRGFDVQRLPILSITPEVEEGLAILDSHIKFLSNDDDACYQYFYNWLASIFQSPGHKGKTTSGVIKSPQGFGKDMFGEFLKNLLGSQYYFNTSCVERDVLGDFNSSMAGKVLVIGNEVRVPSSQVQNLKDFITGSRITINEKKRPQYEVDNNIRFLFFTNLDMPIPIEASDRRFYQFELTGEKPSPEYFDTLVRVIRDKGVQRAFYDRIMARDISAVDFETHRPVTEFYEDSKMLSLDCYTNFFIQFIEGVLLGSDLDSLLISSTDLLEKFSASPYCHKDVGPRFFGHQISRILKNIKGQDSNTSTLRINGVCSKGRVLDIVAIRDYFLSKKYIDEGVVEVHKMNLAGRLLGSDSSSSMSVIDDHPMNRS